MCFSGIDVTTAVETVVEIHDFTRFATAIKRTNPYGQKSKRILERQKNASPEIVAYADKATKRIRTKNEES